jgi:DNA-binding GntR family transcriptional regulator
VVRNQLRRAIMTGELPGGSRLIQSDLAASLGVSVTPVREALRDLGGEGFVEFDDFRGAVVHQRSVAELEEIYELRCILVPVAVRDAVKQITPVELREAAALAKAMKTADPVEWVGLNGEFHSVLDGASRRLRLQEILGRLADLSALYVGVTISGDRGRRARGDRDHAAMVSSYRAGDVERSVELALSHLGDTVAVARAALVEGS